MKRFKKIYIEITNVCNLSCSFCSKSLKQPSFMTVEEFEHIIKEIKNFTDYIYLHVKGEPLLHKDLDNFIKICDINDLKVNITTNATLLKEKYNVLDKHPSIRQLNLSIHSENSIPNYLEDVIETAKKLSTKMFISYRLWTLKDNKLDNKSTEMVKKVIFHYDLSTDVADKLFNDKQIRIANNTFLNKENEFQWPSLQLTREFDGYCLGLIDQVAILVDGSVVPCCLDSDGVITLGNVYKTGFKEIIESDKALKIINGFKNNKSIERLCKKCIFKKRFKNN